MIPQSHPLRTLALTTFALATFVGTAHARVGEHDIAPAATLLVPYFESDTNSSDIDTEIRVQNVTGSAVLARVTLWTDAGYPALSFLVHMPAHGTKRLSIASILSGTLPSVAGSACGSSGSVPAGFGAASASAVRNALTGASTTLVGGACLGFSHGDDHARGFATIDVVSACTAAVPTDATYFTGGARVASDVNALAGELVMLDAMTGTSETIHAVHLEASAADPLITTAGNPTFYGSLRGYDAADHREPLATAWSVNVEDGVSDVFVYRDTLRPAGVGFACGGLPTGYPLSHVDVGVFDQVSQFVDQRASTAFEAAAGRYAVGGATGAIPMTATKGYVYLNLNRTSGGGPAAFPNMRQSYAFALTYPKSLGGRAEMSSSEEGIALDKPSNPDTSSTLDSFSYPYSPGTGTPLGRQPAIGTLDLQGASTLLLPYFEVSTTDPSGVDTVFTVQNDAPAAVLARITLWTDMAVPTRTFFVYLGGLDVAEIDLRLVFQYGIVPRSASAGQDSQDQISPKCPIGQDINFASCNGVLPMAPFTASQLADLRAAHTGQAVAGWGGKCGASPRTDGIARGFITIDAANACDTSATVTSFYASGYGLVTMNNLAGTYTTFERTNGLAYGDNLVPIQASANDPESSTSGQYTFYGRFGGWSAADRREPLASRWQVEFSSDAASETTDLIVFRDPGVVVDAFTCGTTPAGFPLSTASAVAYDDAQATTNLAAGAFPLAAARVPVTSAIGVSATHGVLVLDLDHASAAGGPPENAAARQSFVTAVRTRANGTERSARSAIPLHIAGN